MRRRRAKKREQFPDPKFKDLLVAKMVKMIMERGKKSLAESIVYDCMDKIKDRSGENPLDVFRKSIENVRPLLETKSRRVGGATYQVPLSVRPDRGNTLAMRWIRNSAKNRKGKPMAEKLADEIMDGYNKTGTSYKKKEDTHKMAESNRAFAHYRW